MMNANSLGAAAYIQVHFVHQPINGGFTSKYYSDEVW